LDPACTELAGRDGRVPDTHAAMVCFVIALGATTAVGWWASRLEGLRLRRERDALLAATPAGGIH
jgi:hypothetical protein